jgi:PAS domain S-box-containing protein
MIRKFHIVGMLVCLFLLSGFSLPLSTVFAEEKPQEILAGVLRNFPPQYSIDERTGEPTGFAIDTMDEIARRTGLKVRYRVFDGLAPARQALREGHIDIIPDMGITEERKKDLDFTRPVEALQVHIFVRETTADIKGIDGLRGRKVAVIADTMGLMILREYGKAKPVIFESLDNALLSLLSGNTDALIYPEPPVVLITRKTGLETRIKTAGEPLLEMKRAIAVGKGKTDLLHKLDKAVQAFIATPKYKEIYAKWYVAPEPYWNARRVSVAGGILLALVIVLFAAGHYLSLRRMNGELKRTLERQKKAEAALRERNRYIEAILENSPIGFAVNTIHDGKALFVAGKFKEIYGMSRDSLPTVEEYFEEVYRDPAFREQIRARVTADMASGDPARMRWEDIPLTTAAGEQKFVTAVNIPLLDQDLMVSTVQDVTARHRAEEAREKLQAQLLRAQKMEAIGTLAGGIAHDFNNILGAISGFTEISLEKIPADSRIKYYLEQIQAASQRAIALVKQILEFSRLTEQERIPLSVTPLINEIIKMLREISPSPIEIRLNAKTETDTILGDATQLYQVLMNLCTNAYQAMQDRCGILEVELARIEIGEDRPDKLRGLTPGAYLELTVKDTGKGIDPVVMERIFDPFFTTKKIGEGTGLGLSVVHGIVKSYGGKITVESRVGEGSVFRVYLPLLLVEKREEWTKAPDLPVLDGKGRILLVDDEAMLASMTKEMLEDRGYTVTARTDSIEALETFRANPDRFDLVITDQIMPEMTGIDLAEKVRSIRPDIPVILCTGFINDTIEEKTTKVGIRAVVLKPIRMKRLTELIRALLVPAR